MRRSHLYNKFVSPDIGHIATSDLAKKYQYSSHLGDQVDTYMKLSQQISDIKYRIEKNSTP